MSNKLDIALRYHGLGFNVLPVGGDKRPSVSTWDEWQETRQSETDVRTFDWEASTVKGVAGIAGPVSTDFVNVDIDRCPDQAVVANLLDELWLPQDYEWVVKTGSGFQVWLQCPELSEEMAETGKLVGPYPGCKHVELRWEGHYSVLPPSRHPNGSRYRFLHGRPKERPVRVTAEDLLQLSEWGGKQATDEAGHEQGWQPPCFEEARNATDALWNASRAGESVADHVALVLATVAAAPEGERNDTLYHVAYSLAKLGLLVPNQKLLTEAAVRSGQTEVEARRTIKSAASKVPQPEETTTPAGVDAETGEIKQPSAGTIVLLSDALWKIVEFTKTPMPPGIPFPWSRVQYLTRGLRPGWLCVLAGYTSQGKTAAALECSLEAAKEKRVLFISGEMSDEEVAMRVSQRWGVNTRRMYANRATADDTVWATAAARHKAHENVGIAYTRKMDVIRSLADEFKPGLLVVDYLQYLQIQGREQRLEATTRHIQDLKDVARTRSIPVLVLSQLRRPDRGSRFQAPALDDLRDSGAIEQEADQVLFVYREVDERNKTMLPQGRFIVAKARMGELGSVDFVFDGPSQKFLQVEQRATP